MNEGMNEGNDTAVWLRCVREDGSVGQSTFGAGSEGMQKRKKKKKNEKERRGRAGCAIWLRFETRRAVMSDER